MPPIAYAEHLSIKVTYLFVLCILDQLVPVPSIFFIGESGTPLEIIGNPLSPTDLATKIDSILLKANPQARHSSASFIGAEQQAHSSSSNQQTNKLPDKISADPAAATSGLSQTPKDSSSDDKTSGNALLTQEETAAAEFSQEVIFLIKPCIICKTIGLKNR